jgi:hypothetical protein
VEGEGLWSNILWAISRYLAQSGTLAAAPGLLPVRSCRNTGPCAEGAPARTPGRGSGDAERAVDHRPGIDLGTLGIEAAEIDLHRLDLPNRSGTSTTQVEAPDPDRGDQGQHKKRVAPEEPLS